MRFGPPRRSCVVIIALGWLVGLATGRAEDPKRLAIGATVPDLEFKDIRYLPRSLDDFGGKSAFVIVATNTTCPLAARSLPKLDQLARKYEARGVQFVSLNVGLDDSIMDMAEQSIDLKIASDMPFVKDVDLACARTLGLDRTPQVVVIDAKRRLRYRGRIDDQHRLGGSRPVPSTQELVDAIEAVLGGRELVVSETPVDGCKITMPANRPPDRIPTFAEHVEPLLRKQCQDCHHPGGDSPFSLMSVRDAEGQAEMIAEVVRDGRMPPWYGSVHDGDIVRSRSLSDAERETILAWASNGRPRGDLKAIPPPRAFPKKTWTIEPPDLVVRMPFDHQVPAQGFVDYRYVVLPHIFFQETWVDQIEILPDNPRVVHHCNMAYVTAGSQFSNQNFITGKVPGGDPMVLDKGTAYRIPAGSLLALQIHYTTTGKPERNRISVGFRFPREVVNKRLYHSQVMTGRFAIPPGAAAHEVTARRTLPFDATGVGLFSHMHVRGRDMTFLAKKPGGEAETLLRIPNYNFEWQQSYRWTPATKRFAKGTAFEVVAHFDNSPFNPYNPDSSATVREGDQTFQEMMYGFYFYTRDDEQLNLKVDPRDGRAR